MKTIIKNVSVLTEGEARGHSMLVDGMTLRQLESEIRRKGRVLVKLCHKTNLDAVIGHLSSARVVGKKLLATLSLLRNSRHFAFVRDLIQTFGNSIGLSPAFSGTAEEAADGSRRARVHELFTVDLVESPASNPNGLFAARVGANLYEFSAITTPSRIALSGEASAAAARGIALSRRSNPANIYAL